MALWGDVAEGIFMRLFCVFVLAAFLSALPLALGGEGAEAGIVCGMFDGKFSCRSESKAGAQFGKNATPGAKIDTQDDAPQDTTGGQDAIPPAAGGEGTAGGTPDAATTCQHGMTGTPPNCRCPKNSELLGGNCVHYTASACSNGLASDALPQACPGAEEKLACKMRQDGFKDCCCLTYDKF
jgi:hypothetical protein